MQCGRMLSNDHVQQWQVRAKSLNNMLSPAQRSWYSVQLSGQSTVVNRCQHTGITCEKFSGQFAPPPPSPGLQQCQPSDPSLQKGAAIDHRVTKLFTACKLSEQGVTQSHRSHYARPNTVSRSTAQCAAASATLCQQTAVLLEDSAQAGGKSSRNAAAATSIGACAVTMDRRCSAAAGGAE